jgi:VIT1/CCC1 family predicted Fe2+/Mn2+ transporter
LKNENHYGDRSGLLRAAILGANDGILSVTSIVIGVAAAGQKPEAIILAGLAGLVAGAFSMAAGEYVSVSSQSDIETGDLKREQLELEHHYEEELEELTGIYEGRGLDRELSLQVAEQLMKNDALKAHARDELGINEITTANPLQAALSSAGSFLVGGALPVLLAFLIPLHLMEYVQYIGALCFLIILGTVAAKAGGSSIPKAVLRISFWGTLAMGMTALVGHLFGTGVAI